MAELTYTSPIKFDCAPIPKSKVIFEFRLKGSKYRIKVNADINIFYKDPYAIGKVFLLNSGIQNVYTSTDDSIHRLEFKIPDFQNRTQSHIYMTMEPVGDPYQKVIVEDVKITAHAPPIPEIKVEPKIEPRLEQVILSKIEPLPKIESIQLIPTSVKSPLKDIDGKFKVICEGPMFGHSGFSKAMRNIAYGLDKIGCNVKTIVHDTNNNDSLNTEKGKKIDELRWKNIEGRCIWITMTHPAGVRSHNDNYSVGYVMFETEDFPDNFSQNLRQQNEIWTPSNFCRNSMIRSGLSNVYVMPLGVDTELFNPNIDVPVQIINNLIYMVKKFKFLSVMAYSERKGPSLLARAFVEEFNGNDDVALYIKGAWYDINNARSEINDVIKDITNPPYIHLDFNIYSDNLLAALYKSCDCFVFPTKGEGWGLTLIEAMSMEMPAIATRWGGHLEFMNNDNSYLIDIDGLGPEPRCGWLTPEYNGRNFAIPNKNHLRKLMRHVYEHREDAKLKGKKAREHVVNNFTWEKCCERINNRLNSISNDYD